MDALIPIYMDNTSCWGGELLKSFLVKEDQVDADASDFAFINKNKPFTQSEIYKLYDNQGKFIVVFSENSGG